ncbi:hypothetical protein IV102_37870 [bacterium]|nr:hypothetical protein [bacterium]
MMALLLASEGQLEVFFGQIATTLEPDAREELLARLNYDLGHIRTSLERVEAAQPNTKANLKKVLEANQDCMPAAQAPKVWPANARKGEDPFQRMWDQNQENRQKEAEKFAMDLLKQREQIHLRNQKRSAKRMEVADEIAKERRKSL